MGEHVTIRSYRRVFNIDRRIYRIEDWRLDFIPSGIPLRGVAYFVAVLILIVLLEHVLVIGDLLDILSPPLRYVILPGGAAWAGTQANADGRPAGLFAISWLRLHIQQLRPPPATRDWKCKLPVRWDIHAPRLWPARITGPCTITLHEPVTLRHGRSSLIARRGRGVHQPTMTLTGQRGLEIR